MRAGPLSDLKVIALLNQYFIPVYVSNEDYDKDGARSAEEKKEYLRIYHEALKEKRAAGSVCVYLLRPQGQGLDSRIVSAAAQPGNLKNMLESAIKKLGTAKGKTLVQPAAQSTAPKSRAGSLVLHLVSRYDHRGSWGEFPSENWIVLARADWRKLLPPAPLRAGTAWEVDKETAGKLLTYFYPQTETCDADHAVSDPDKHRLEGHQLKVRVLRADGAGVRIRLEGKVKIKHRFYPGRPDNNVATAALVGYMDLDGGAKKLRSLRLVTTQATYGGHKYGAAIRSLP